MLVLTRMVQVVCLVSLVFLVRAIAVLLWHEMKEYKNGYGN
jgi:hypothetical protein